MTETGPSVATSEALLARVLVSIDVSPSSRAALVAACAVAGVLEAELVSLCVEDRDVSRLAALPLAQEIAFSSRRTRNLDSELVKREFTVRAEAARRAVSQLAQEASLKWAFSIVEGRNNTVLAQAAGAQDLLVTSLDAPCFRTRESLLRYVEEVVERRGASLLVLREAKAERQVRLSHGLRPVVTVDEGGRRGAQACALGARIAQNRSMVMRALSGQFKTAHKFADEARTLKASLFVIPFEQLGSIEKIDLRALTATCACPMLILGPGKAPKSAL